MPCWFYDRKDLVNTPSARDGISAEVEAWYRKEGAKHIIDAGNKLGLYLLVSSALIRSFDAHVTCVHVRKGNWNFRTKELSFSGDAVARNGSSFTSPLHVLLS